MRHVGGRQGGLSCNRSAGRSIRHHQLNDLIGQALTPAISPSVKQPTGLSCSDCKLPDGLSLILWQGGKCLTCDVTVADTLAATYLQLIDYRRDFVTNLQM